MKRSEINEAIREAKTFFIDMNFHLPLWAFWAPEEWKGKANLADEIVACGLGWDITDFGSDDFPRIGLINFNLRNGTVTQDIKPYCEKAIIVQENQVTPTHTHNLKIEDIINRGGGNLIIELFHYDDGFKLTDKPVTVRIDAVEKTVPTGGIVILTPGESICLRPGMYHKFYGQEGRGMVLVGEVSSVNDDTDDNVFVEGAPRFPEIVEDTAPIHLLVNDYRKFL